MIDFSPQWMRLRIEYELSRAHHFDFIVPMIRGALGYSLYESYCRNRLGRCQDCASRPNCLYYRLFEANDYGRGGRKITSFHLHPFQLSQYEYPTDEHDSADKISFYLTLLGEPAALYPVFISQFRQTGSIGLGKSSIPSRCMHIYDLEGNRLLQPGSNKFESPPVYSLADIQRMVEAVSPGPDTLKIKFITPLQIKANGKFCSRLDFPRLIRAIIRRLNLMEIFYSGSRRIDADPFIEQAKTVETVESKLRWVRHSRYSTRRRKPMPLSGIVGHLTVHGDLTPFLPLLLLGEIFHIGAKTTFGLGQYLTYSL